MDLSGGGVGESWRRLLDEGRGPVPISMSPAGSRYWRKRSTSDSSAGDQSATPGWLKMDSESVMKTSSVKVFSESSPSSRASASFSWLPVTWDIIKRFAE